MPRLIPADPAPQAIGLTDFVDAVATSGFDPADEESFAAMGPLLGRLAADRDFLGDLIVAALKDGGVAQEAGNPYGAQVIMLHWGDGWFVRANIWPAADDAAVRASGNAPFFYGVPHDHNFSFLTAGYFGPGYWSDYWEYDWAAVHGHVGEAVDLRFIERARLSEGKLMLYRAHRDVHAQHPPDSLSVSLNLMQSARSQVWRDQYRFDVARGVIDGIVSTHAADGLVALLPALGGAEGRDLLEHFARHHPSDRIRFGAIDALASCGTVEARADIYARAANGLGYVAGMARHRLAQIEAGACWRASADRGQNGAVSTGIR